MSLVPSKIEFSQDEMSLIGIAIRDQIFQSKKSLESVVFVATFDLNPEALAKNLELQGYWESRIQAHEALLEKINDLAWIHLVHGAVRVPFESLNMIADS